MTMTGSCLCGSVSFSAEPIQGAVFNCHCSRCRRSHGADYATQVFAVRSSLRFDKGESALTAYESIGGMRCFCSKCGSRLMNYAKQGGDYLSIAAACLDEGYEGEAIAHCFTGSKARWHNPYSGITSHEALPDKL